MGIACIQVDTVRPSSWIFAPAFLLSNFYSCYSLCDIVCLFLLCYTIDSFLLTLFGHFDVLMLTQPPLNSYLHLLMFCSYLSPLCQCNIVMSLLTDSPS